MKKIFFSAAVILISSSLFAQTEVLPNVVKVNPLGFVIGTANVGYERALNPKSSIVILPSFGMLKSGNFKYTTYGLGAEYRFYLTGSAPRGTYAAPGASAVFGTAKFDNSDGSNASTTNVSGFAVKAIIGHQWIWNSRFVLDLNGGVQYLDLSFKDKTGDFAGQTAVNGIIPALSVSLGFNF